MIRVRLCFLKLNGKSMPLSAWSSWRYDAQEKLCNGTHKNKSAKSRSTIGYWRLQGLLFHRFLFFPYIYPFSLPFLPQMYCMHMIPSSLESFKDMYRADLMKLRIKFLNPPSLPKFSLLPTFVHVQIQILEFISTYNTHSLNCELHVSM